MEKTLPDIVITKHGDGETCGDYYSKEAQAINQLITYLAELTEVVEGKKCQCNITPRNVHYRDCPLATPSLKKQLLGELTKLTLWGRIAGYGEVDAVLLEEVEEIINRLMK